MMDGKSKKSKDGDMVSKFQGDGMLFRAKLYGSVEVTEARGDVMCQQSLQHLKNNIKGNGAHKKKIVFKVNIKGVTLVDSANGAVLHQHPVNRISFISKDRTDSRSFAYIVGIAEGKHVLFGVKTEKASDVVVLALRDLFQAVYQLSQRATQNQCSGNKTSSQSLDSQNNPNSNLAACSMSNDLPVNSPDDARSSPTTLSGANTPSSHTSQLSPTLDTDTPSSSPPSKLQNDSGSTDVVSSPPTNAVTESHQLPSEPEQIVAHDSALDILSSPPSKEEVSLRSAPEAPPTASLATPDDPFNTSKSTPEYSLNSLKTTPDDLFITSKPTPEDPFVSSEPIPDDSFTTSKPTPEDRLTALKSTPDGSFATSEATPEDPFNSLKPTPDDPFSSPKPASDDPFSSPKPASDDLFSSPNPASDDPLGRPKPASDDPFSSPKPASDDPFSSPKPASDDPFSSPKPASDDPFSSPKPASDDPFSSLKLASDDPFSTPGLTLNVPVIASEPTLDDPFITPEDPFTECVPAAESVFDASNPWGSSETWKSNDSWNPFAPAEMNFAEPQNIAPSTRKEDLSETVTNETIVVSPGNNPTKTTSDMDMQNQSKFGTDFKPPTLTTPTAACGLESAVTTEQSSDHPVNKDCPSEDPPSSDVDLTALELEDSISNHIDPKVNPEVKPFESMDNPWESADQDPFSDFNVAADKFDPFATDSAFVLDDKETLFSSKADGQQFSASRGEFDEDDTGNNALGTIDPFDDSWFKGINTRQQVDIPHNIVNSLPNGKDIQERDGVESITSTNNKVADQKADDNLKDTKLQSGGGKPNTENYEGASFEIVAGASSDAGDSRITELTGTHSQVGNDDIPCEFEPPSCLAPSLPPNVPDDSVDTPPPTMPPPTMPPPAMPPRKVVPPAVPKRQLSSGPPPPIPSRPAVIVSPKQSTMPKVDAFIFEENYQTITSEPPSLPPPSVPPPSAPTNTSPPSLPPRVPHRTNI